MPLLLRVPGEAVPRYYQLPWAIGRAQELQLAITEAAIGGQSRTSEGRSAVDLSISAEVLGDPAPDPLDLLRLAALRPAAVSAEAASAIGGTAS